MNLLFRTKTGNFFLIFFAAFLLCTSFNGLRASEGHDDDDDGSELDKEFLKESLRNIAAQKNMNQADQNFLDSGELENEALFSIMNRYHLPNLITKKNHKFQKGLDDGIEEAGKLIGAQIISLAASPEFRKIGQEASLKSLKENQFLNKAIFKEELKNAEVQEIKILKQQVKLAEDEKIQNLKKQLIRKELSDVKFQEIEVLKQQVQLADNEKVQDLKKQLIRKKIEEQLSNVQFQEIEGLKQQAQLADNEEVQDLKKQLIRKEIEEQLSNVQFQEIEVLKQQTQLANNEEVQNLKKQLIRKEIEEQKYIRNLQTGGLFGRFLSGLAEFGSNVSYTFGLGFIRSIAEGFSLVATEKLLAPLLDTTNKRLAEANLYIEKLNLAIKNNNPYAANIALKGYVKRIERIKEHNEQKNLLENIATDLIHFKSFENNAHKNNMTSLAKIIHDVSIWLQNGDAELAKGKTRITPYSQYKKHVFIPKAPTLSFEKLSKFKEKKECSEHEVENAEEHVQNIEQMSESEALNIPS